VLCCCFFQCCALLAALRFVIALVATSRGGLATRGVNLGDRRATKALSLVVDHKISPPIYYTDFVIFNQAQGLWQLGLGLRACAS
jgi:hypothetical protein